MFIIHDFNFVVTYGAEATITLKTHKSGELISCSVFPTEGIALKTKFLIDCQYTGSGYVWQIFRKKEDSGENVLLHISLCLFSIFNAFFCTKRQGLELEQKSKYFNVHVYMEFSSHPFLQK